MDAPVTKPSKTREFYDEIAGLYHLVYADWNRSIDLQGRVLSDLIETRWPESREVLDAACGIGTQALGLAADRRLTVAASDLSASAIDRAQREAEVKGVDIEFSVCDLRGLATHHHRSFDVVLACDNVLPHFLTDEEILAALRQIVACTRRGGGVVVSLRDYDAEPRGRGLIHPFGTRDDNGERWFVFQVWDFDPPSRAKDDGGDRYDFAMYFVPESDPAMTRVSTGRYYAISPSRLAELMAAAGLRDVERIDDLYFQPLLVGTKD